MSSSEPNQRQQEAPQIYTIYQGTPGNVNYGFTPSHPMAPPPKYEDVINGSYQHQNISRSIIIQQERVEPEGVIFISPQQNQIATRRLARISLILTFLFITFCISSIYVIIQRH